MVAKTGRRWLLLSATCLTVVAAAACSDSSGSDASTTTTVAGASPDSIAATTPAFVADATAPPNGIVLPDTPVGRQLRWVLDELPDAPADAFPEHFAAEFLAQIPPAEIRSAVAETAVSAVGETVTSSETELVLIVTTASGQGVLSITVEAVEPHLIVGLGAGPAGLPDPPTTWEGIDAALADAAPRFTYLAAEVDDAGGLTTIRTAGSGESVPLGSGFKLYVLGALVHAVESGEIGWDDELTITDELKSLPSGVLQDRPAGDTVSVREAAEKMIQISDNTATDLLIDRLGRDAVEAMLAPMGMGAESQQRTLPLLTTREMFTLKWGSDTSELDAYIAADAAGRREILAGLGDQLPALTDLVAHPVAIDDVEWFATAAEIASAHLWLDAYRDRQGFEPLAAILGTSPGVTLDRTVWPQSSYKGGSEPGVAFYGWLLHRADGRRFVVVVSACNPAAPIDELQVASVGQGIIELIASHQ